MSDAAASPARASSPATWVVAGLAAAFALAVGLAAGDPGSGMLLPVAAIVGLGVVAGVIARPFAGFLALAFSVFFLVVVPVGGTGRAANAFDVVLVPLLAVSLLGAARREAGTRAGREAGAPNAALMAADRRLRRGVLLYFGLAVLSIAVMALRLGAVPAFNSMLSLVRVVEVSLLYPLAAWWLDDEKRMDATVRTVLGAGIALAGINLIMDVVAQVPRAGMVWTLGEMSQPIGSPNEAGAALVVLWALLMARYRSKPSRWHPVLMGMVLIMLPLTQSRSAILALITLIAMTVRRVRWRWIVGLLVVLAAVPFIVPAQYWERLSRTLTMRQGSPEMFSILVRFYGFRTAWRVFLDNPVFGVGYLGYRFVSVRYNEMGLVLITAENFLLETMAGLGLVGLGVVVLVLHRLYAVGTAVRRAAPPGTFAHELARMHTPLVTALLVANLSGDTFVGMGGIGQLALWTALVVRAGHLAVREAARA